MGFSGLQAPTRKHRVSKDKLRSVDNIIEAFTFLEVMAR
jgi:hypothetical protein